MTVPRFRTSRLRAIEQVRSSVGLSRARRWRLLNAVGASVLLFGVSPGALAQDFDVFWSELNSGAGEMAGGSLQVTATAGYGGVEVLTGGSFRLVGGFWNPVSAIPCDGDLNGDRFVSLPDIAILLSNFGTASGATFDMGDLNGDGAVSLPDLSLCLANFGFICPR